ncbi:DUF1232 domain-containing protein [bacterium]|nr:DUF1232 domain-containing protein [bacterium]
MNEPDQTRLGSGELLAGALAGVGLEDTPQNRERYRFLSYQIEKQFNNLRVSATETEVLRALKDGEEHIRSLLQSAKTFEASVGRRAAVLLRLLQDVRKGEFDAPWSTVSAVTAALCYLLSEADVVPDALPVVGMFDDLLVVLLCAVLIRPDLERYAKEKAINLHEIGL